MDSATVALNIRGSTCNPALYAVVFRRVSVVDNLHYPFSVGTVDAHNVMFIDCDFLENKAHDIVYLQRSHNVTFINCNFFRNYHTSAIVNLHYSNNVTFINCSIYENKDTSGG